MQFKALSDMNFNNSAKNKIKKKKKNKEYRNFSNEESTYVLSHKETEKQENMRISLMVNESAASSSSSCQKETVSSDYQSGISLIYIFI